MLEVFKNYTPSFSTVGKLVVEFERGRKKLGDQFYRRCVTKKDLEESLWI